MEEDTISNRWREDVKRSEDRQKPEMEELSQRDETDGKRYNRWKNKMEDNKTQSNSASSVPTSAAAKRTHTQILESCGP